MANYRGHVAGGAATFLIIAYTTTKLFPAPLYTPKELLLALLFCLLGSLFPDVDIKSVGQRIFYTVLTIFIIITILTQQWLLLSMLSLISIFPLLVNHRGIIHTIGFVTLAPLVILFVTHYLLPTSNLLGKYDLFSRTTWILYGYFVAGALSHLLLDYGISHKYKRLFKRR